MTPTEQYNEELYHYGVKGMKWGVRKSRAEIEALRLARYKKSEISSIERRRRSQSKWEDRAVNRRTKKYNNAVEKYGIDSKKAVRAKERLVKAKTNAIVGRKVAEAEIKRVGKMTLSDVKEERLRSGLMAIQNMALRSYAHDQYTSGNRYQARVAMNRYYRNDINKHKTSSRVGIPMISDIRKKAEREARKSIK